MHNVIDLSKKMITLAVAAIMLIALTTILTPEAEAASETTITETSQSITSTYTSDKDDALELSRAITIDEAKAEAQKIVEKLAKVEPTEAEQPESTVSSSSESTQTYTETQSSSQSSSTSSVAQSNSYVTGSSSSNYLIDIKNPDPNYSSYSVKLSDSDRELAERIVMGESGYCGYTGMALVAQCLRDAFVKGGYSSMKDVASQYSYTGLRSIEPSSTCKEVINYIFDQGGAAVQHRILVYYATNYCTSSWHESQNFVCSDGHVRFFDTWY